ncbi:MAG: alpha/beta hydrolase [bacterium]
MQTVISNKILEYSYIKAKESSRGNVIFLHGWGCNKEIFSPIINELTNYDIYSLDLPGFGNSEKIKDAMNIDDYVTSVDSFINKLNLDNVIIIGHSLGGRICIKLASKNSSYLKKIVLVDSAGIEKEKSNLSKYFEGLKKIPIIKEAAIKVFGSRDYKDNKEMRETLKLVVSEDLTLVLSLIQVPTLIIWGKEDKDTPLADGQLMNNHIKGSKLVVIKDAGHFSFLDKPIEFTNAVKEFII